MLESLFSFGKARKITDIQILFDGITDLDPQVSDPQFLEWLANNARMFLRQQHKMAEAAQGPIKRNGYFRFLHNLDR